MVGLVVETRPCAVSPESLTLLRRFGCTKLQMGVQSVNPDVLRANGREASLDSVRNAFELARLFGYKTHAHFMLNLQGATPEADKCDYAEFVQNLAYLPDEVKLYPCALVAGTALEQSYEQGKWYPYTEEELVDVLAADVLATPAYLRISRMIRDISAQDILVGNKKTNLRQLVDAYLEHRGEAVREIRFREIGTAGLEKTAGTESAAQQALRLEELPYETNATREYFLQWVGERGEIAGFLRLSLPKAAALARGDVGVAGDKSGHHDKMHDKERDKRRDLLPCRDAAGEHARCMALPVCEGEAMIREVHVYGQVAKLHETGGGAQHLGLGRALIERACTIAREEGYTAINVISAVGTREYYRGLDFRDNGLYQQRSLTG